MTRPIALNPPPLHGINNNSRTSKGKPLVDRKAPWRNAEAIKQLKKRLTQSREEGGGNLNCSLASSGEKKKTPSGTTTDT